jgi:hypothetical protein
MNIALLRAGQLVGLVGLMLMAVSVAARLGGNFTLGGFATGTLLLAGIGGVTAGCFFVLLWLAADRLRR